MAGRRTSGSVWRRLIETALRLQTQHGRAIAEPYLRLYGVDAQTALRVLTTSQRRKSLSCCTFKG